LDNAGVLGLGSDDNVAAAQAAAEQELTQERQQVKETWCFLANTFATHPCIRMRLDFFFFCLFYWVRLVLMLFTFVFLFYTLANACF